MPQDPGSRHILSIQKLIADTNKAEAISKTASEQFSLAQMQALLDANTEMEDAQAEQQAQQQAAQQAEEAQKAALGPFQLELPADGAIAERPVAFRNPLSQIPAGGMGQAARGGLSASAMIQQRLRDSGVVPQGVPEALQGLPVAGDTLRQTQTQRSLTPASIGQGGFVLLPNEQQTVSEQPNVLTAQDQLAARQFEQRQQQAQTLAQAKQQGGLTEIAFRETLASESELKRDA